ncbi:gliding motility protein GldB-related protein [Massilia endophytica]|uniref:gliding motility protein GldB-related protein n=1 Tax=Massilia endophytica TaxID=2899220 RepID=UPI001E598272|nr:hypothetical protein [Massilia endophytica]UGQ45356.1 hypothetical protein LSQ66_16380 [Massilia endophytica]
MTIKPFITAFMLAASFAGSAAAATTQQLIADARAHIGKKEYAAAAASFRQAMDQGAGHPSVIYDAACALALEGKREEALAMAERAAAAGMRGRLMVENDSDLLPLHGDARWAAVLEKISANDAAYRALRSDPDRARIVTSDIDRFWSVYDRAAQAADPGALYDTDYLEPGSPGLHSFINMRIRSGASLHAVTQKHARYYKAIRANTLRVKEMEGEIRASLHKFKALYDDATFGDIYFVIGALSSGGTASSDGLIMGAEMFSRDDSVPIDELSPWLRNGTKTAALIPNITIHELMHTQQQVPENTLLAGALKEGTADFLASLISNGNFNEVTYAYGYKHEAALKQAFAEDVKRNERKRWFGAGSMEGDRPADLGYFMGFRIAQAYYNRSADKKAAVKTLLTYRDPEQILRESAYLQ